MVHPQIKTPSCPLSPFFFVGTAGASRDERRAIFARGAHDRARRAVAPDRPALRRCVSFEYPRGVLSSHRPNHPHLGLDRLSDTLARIFFLRRVPLPGIGARSLLSFVDFRVFLVLLTFH